MNIKYTPKNGTQTSVQGIKVPKDGLVVAKSIKEFQVFVPSILKVEKTDEPITGSIVKGVEETKADVESTEKDNSDAEVTKDPKLPEEPPKDEDKKDAPPKQTRRTRAQINADNAKEEEASK